MKHYTVEITNEALAERIGIMESELSIRYSSFSIRQLFVTALSLA